MITPTHSYNRRDKRLDALLGRAVEITFTDGEKETGVLGWNEHLEPLMLVPQHYYLRLASGSHLSFRKSYVKSVKEI
jgi:hypothetical protein